MPPKMRITKEEIIKTALEIVRLRGDDALNAREIAARLGCSTQPIFSNFATMEELRFAVINAAYALQRDFLHREMSSAQYPPYKASGMAYIRFASEEKELFKLLFMRDRRDEGTLGEDEEMLELVTSNIGCTREEARLFHLEMWVCVHGIAVMIATDYLTPEWELISRMLSDFYRSLRQDLEQRGK